MRINALSLESKHYKLKLREILDVRGLMVDINDLQTEVHYS